MNILLSSYACEPNRGSEQGVGWEWANRYALFNNVWVITRKRNEKRIQDYFEKNPQNKRPRLHFVYVDGPRFLSKIKKGNRWLRLYYYLWQKQAMKIAKQLSIHIKFDYVQHITFVSCIQPTFMYRLGIPFVFGPVAGGERIPKTISIKMSFKEKIGELIRAISQKMCMAFPRTKATLKKASLILCTTDETFQIIPQKYKAKAYIMPAIGLEHTFKKESKANKKEFVEIVMAGRLIYWKAFDIGIIAVKKMLEKGYKIKLHILGDGPKKDDLIKLAGDCFNTHIFFDGSIEHDKIFDYYKRFDIFLNTTLRDSGCMTMLEAVSCGLNCVSLSCGGPSVIGSYFSNVALVPVSSYLKTIEDLVSELEKMLANPLNTPNYSSNNLFVFENKFSFIKEFLFGDNK